MKTRKSWQEKMNNPHLPRIVPIPTRMEKSHGTGTMLLPSAQDVHEFIRTIPRGEVTTPYQIRESLALKYGTDMTCPMLTGILMWVTANAIEEAAAEAGADLVPYWRVVKDDGSLNPKFPGGVEQQATRLRAEGHHIVDSAGSRPPHVILPCNRLKAQHLSTTAHV